jgi:hypothetical protein
VYSSTEARNTPACTPLAPPSPNTSTWDPSRALRRWAARRV